MEGLANAPQASYSLIEGARLGRPWDRLWPPNYVCRLGNDVCCFAEMTAFSYLGQPAILSTRSRSFRHALPFGVFS